MSEKCGDPCPGACGTNALCQVINHSPVCECHPGHVGNPYHSCRLPQRERKKISLFELPKTDPNAHSLNNNNLLKVSAPLLYIDLINPSLLFCDILIKLCKAVFKSTTF